MHKYQKFILMLSFELPLFFNSNYFIFLTTIPRCTEFLYTDSRWLILTVVLGQPSIMAVPEKFVFTYVDKIKIK